MKLDIAEDRTIELTEVFLPVKLISANGETISIAMRDSGFEFVYEGTVYSAKEGVVEMMKTSSRGNVLVDQSEVGNSCNCHVAFDDNQL